MWIHSWKRIKTRVIPEFKIIVAYESVRLAYAPHNDYNDKE